MIHSHWINGEEKIDRFQAMKTYGAERRVRVKIVHKDF
jgi:hypothetical protein